MNCSPMRGRLAAGLCAVLAAGLPMLTQAASHREAPGITERPKVDGTDLFMFRSYEPGREGYVTILSNYIPFQDPFAGPNYYMFSDKALYEIHIDNNGDAQEDVTFQFRFQNTSKGQTVSVGGAPVKIPLIISGPVAGKNAATLNVRETFTLDVVRGDRRTGQRTRVGYGSGDQFDKPVDNIGEKTFGGQAGYAAYAQQHVYNVSIPGCGDGRVFVGQRKEPFYIPVGQIFDLFNLNPLGPEVNGNENDLAYKNVSTIALEVPISCLVRQGEPVIGAWMTSSVRQGHLVNPKPGPGLGNTEVAGGAWTQVSRLGMPLVNEAVIGLDDKDRFNHSKPKDDAQFLKYVTNPTLPALIETLFPAAKAPTNFPRTDLVTVFLKGIQGLNQPANVTPSEMLRLNTSIPPVPAAQQNPLGVAAGDNAGFPNGRRVADDVSDLSIRVAMGALCVLTGQNDMLKVGCRPSDAPAGGLPFTDGVRRTATSYPTSFPYQETPLPGNFNR